MMTVTARTFTTSNQKENHQLLCLCNAIQYDSCMMLPYLLIIFMARTELLIYFNF